MALHPGLKSLFVIAGITLISLPAAAGSSPALSPSLIVRVNDTTAYPSSAGTVSVYLTSTADTVAAFSVWLQLDRPDLIRFQIESSNILRVDTVGTLIGGWQYVEGRTVGLQGTDALVACMATKYPGPPQPGIPPAPGERLLFRLPFTSQSVLDTMTDRTVRIHVVKEFLDKFSFATPQGNSIGVYQAYVPDSNMYLCMQRLPDNTCASWQRVAGPPYDSVWNHTDTIAVLDTNVVKSHDGSVFIRPCTGGYPVVGRDYPNTVGDLVNLIRCITSGDFSSIDPRTADVNGDCFVDYADGRIIMDYIEHGMQVQIAPCTCQNPVWRCCSNRRGNLDRDLNDVVDLSDLTVLIDFLFGSAGPLACTKAANVDGDPGETVDVSDLTYLVDYLFNNGAMPPPCQ
jgi:hypothetical protein